MTTSRIEWTQITWNPTTGCTKISPGCQNCYAERMSKRLYSMGIKKYEEGFCPKFHEEVLQVPLTWKKPKLIFVDSMSDLFHEKIPMDSIQKVFDLMRKASWHQFQILTKRSERLAEISPQSDWPSNVWMGVSVENQDYIYRINHLKNTNASIKFLSLEPLLGPLDNISLNEINWVIVGGESGPGARPIKNEWVINIKNKCIDNNVPFFFKQWGGISKKRNGRLLEGRIWGELPNLSKE
jgi:protein gp37